MSLWALAPRRAAGLQRVDFHLELGNPYKLHVELLAVRRHLGLQTENTFSELREGGRLDRARHGS